MRKIKDLIETTEVKHRTFQIVFDDETTFEFEIILDNDEYVLEGQNPNKNGIRYCQEELEEILYIIQRLNEGRKS